VLLLVLLLPLQALQGPPAAVKLAAAVVAPMLAAVAAAAAAAPSCHRQIACLQDRGSRLRCCVSAGCCLWQLRRRCLLCCWRQSLTKHATLGRLQQLLLLQLHWLQP
jgi:hypothetical protein